MQIAAYTDGGSRGNPGNAATGGIIVTLQKEVLFEFSQYIGIATNNEAEYSALVTVLEWVSQQPEKYSSITCYLDSKLVVEQLNKNWKIKEPRMRTFAQKCWDIISEFQITATFVHIPREQNKIADALVNKALDSQQL